MFTLIILIFISVSNAASAGSNIVISEIMFNPNGNENVREFVEILNVSSGPVSLEGYSIGDGTGFDLLVAVSEGEWSVQAGSYALIMDPDYFTSDEQYDTLPEGIRLYTVGDKALGSRGLSNSTAEPVYLISAGGDTLSVVRYSLDCPPGHSWERILPNGGDSVDNFTPSKTIDGTPGRPNSALPPVNNPALDESSLRLYPDYPEMGDRIEIGVNFINKGLDPVKDVTVSVTVLSGFFSGSVHFTGEVSPGERSPEAAVFIESIPGGCIGFEAAIVSDSENGSTADDTLLVEIEIPVPTGSVILNEVMAAPGDGSPEWIEVMNVSPFSVDLYRWRIRDLNGRTSIPVDSHVIILPDDYAVISSGPLDYIVNGTPVILAGSFPALNNDGDTVSLLDCTGAVTDSMRYDDTQTGYSLELISAHMSGSHDGWDVSVDPSGATPGGRNSIYFSSVPNGNEPEIDSPKLHIIPNPFMDEAVISYELPFPLARVRLLVYDRRGRQVATIRDTEESGSSWSGRWNGRSGGRRLPAGPYIIDFEVIDKRTGKMHRERKTVVVASPL